MRPVLTVLAALAVTTAGCDPGLDALYALPLSAPPGEGEWDGAVVRHVLARGGRTSQRSAAAVDGDAVHRATASCHHGSPVPPVDVELRAFHDGGRLYLRVTWSDPTPQRGPRWVWEGDRWHAVVEPQDGLGILWGSDPAGFSCAAACHLEDWRVAGERAFADYAMAAPAGGPALDLWLWKAGWGAPEGAGADARLDAEGRRGDGGRDLFEPNSRRYRDGDDPPWDAGDLPLAFPERRPGAVAPGYLRVAEAAGGDEVHARGQWHAGRWTVTLSRPLQGTDPEDLAFAPGGTYAFGLALLDGVVEDHTAVPTPIRLVLVSARQTGENEKLR